MAVVKANFVKRGTGEHARAKATIRYIEHRKGKDGQKITRQLFGSDGAMERQEAYSMIDGAEKGCIFFRFVISPDPQEEDKRRDLDMRILSEQTMQQLNEKFQKFQKPVQWVGAIHADHAPNRHVHVLAVVPGRLNTQDFQIMRAKATAASLEQRKELDLIRQQREREKAQGIKQELELSL